MDTVQRCEAVLYGNLSTFSHKTGLSAITNGTLSHKNGNSAYIFSALLHKVGTTARAEHAYFPKHCLFLFVHKTITRIKPHIDMNYEIERKFLVKGEFKSQAFTHRRIVQGYLSSVPKRVVRIRIKGDEAYLTVKSTVSGNGLTRFEWEKEISVEDAETMLTFCEKEIIEKTRYLVKVGAHIFEVDEFYGSNEGLFVAEVELQAEDEEFEKPDWLGEEVTHDVRYYNSMLVKNPYSKWEK
jgi:adenylate cyclase